MTKFVADKCMKEINFEHVMQVNDLLQRVLKGSVSIEQMQAIALAIGSGQNPSTKALAHMIKFAYLRKPEEIKRFLAEQFVMYEAIQKTLRHVIDCDAKPFIPQGWKLVEHKKSGQFEWTKELFTDLKFLYFDIGQQNASVMVGHDLREALVGKSVMNATVLDWLLAHKEEIPESWKAYAVSFWGTIYKNATGDLCVRNLSWNGESWRSSNYWLNGDWDACLPALLSSISN